MIGRSTIQAGATLILLAAHQAWAHADAPPIVIDFISHNEIVVNADARSIWPHILKLSDWKQGAELVPIDERSDSVGGRFKVVEGNPPAVAYIENVEVVPQRLRTIRVDNPDGLYGYASWRLTEQGSSTR